MEYDPPDSPYRRAADRMAAAHQLITRERFREALDILNTAIVIAPTYPLAYKLRAVVFDNLGLTAQAEADRLRERELAATEGYPVADVVDGIATITMRRVARRGGGITKREPARSTSQVVGGLLSPAIFGILMLVGVIIAGIGGVLLAIDSLDDNGGGTVLRPGDNASPTVAGATETPTATTTEEPTPEPIVDVDGTPFSLSSVTGAWEDAGFSVTSNGPAEGFEGFENNATSIGLSGGGDFAVFVYEDASAASSDWIISGSGVPEAQPGRDFPPSQSVWFNRNIIVVVLSGVAGAFEAFVDMTP